MPKVIGIVGTRRRDTLADFQRTRDVFYTIYEPGDRITSGGCPQGGDRFAELIDIGLRIKYTDAALWSLTLSERYALLSPEFIIHPAEWTKHGKIAGFLRNTAIAKSADCLIACVSEDRKGGTEDTIKKFLNMRKSKERIILV
jgi:hypothetical protein